MAWVSVLCPACGRKAQLLKLHDGRPQCRACLKRRGVQFKIAYGMRLERAEARTKLEKLRAKLAGGSTPDRKATAQLLSAKGLSTRQIAKITGWKQRTIQRDLATNVAEEATNVAEDEPPVEAVAIEAEAGEVEPEIIETIVLDPPWPMTRDVRPNQVIFDYPTMSEDELRAFSGQLRTPISQLARGWLAR